MSCYRKLHLFVAQKLQRDVKLSKAFFERDPSRLHEGKIIDFHGRPDRCLDPREGMDSALFREEKDVNLRSLIEQTVCFKAVLCFVQAALNLKGLSEARQKQNAL